MLRVATVADVPALERLIEESVRGLQAADYTPAQMDGALGYALGLDTQLVRDGTYFVAEMPGEGESRLAGCGGWSRRRTLFGSDHGPHREDGLLDPATEAAKIRAIFVHPAYARRGVGSALLEHCERAARAGGFTELEMGATLTGAPMYARRGYRETGRVKVPLPNGEVLEVVTMRKDAGVA